MAAIITLGTLALASNGITLTAAISGGSPAYTPTSGITGLTVFRNGFAVSQSSTGISSTQLTVTLTAPIGISDTVTFSISSGSNLTDSAANTPTGQSGLAVTNNSTQRPLLPPAGNTTMPSLGSLRTY